MTLDTAKNQKHFALVSNLTLVGKVDWNAEAKFLGAWLRMQSFRATPLHLERTLKSRQAQAMH